MQRTIIATSLLALMWGTVACSGQRSFKQLEEITEQGRWSIDHTLIRSYSISLDQAHEAADELFKTSSWPIENRDGHAYDAKIEGRNAEGEPVRIEIWAPKGEATFIGVRVGKDGNRVESVRILDRLEASLPGDRVRLN